MDIFDHVLHLGLCVRIAFPSYIAKLARWLPAWLHVRKTEDSATVRDSTKSFMWLSACTLAYIVGYTSACTTTGVVACLGNMDYRMLFRCPSTRHGDAYALVDFAVEHIGCLMVNLCT